MVLCSKQTHLLCEQLYFGIGKFPDNKVNAIDCLNFNGNIPHLFSCQNEEIVLFVKVIVVKANSGELLTEKQIGKITGECIMAQEKLGSWLNQ